MKIKNLKLKNNLILAPMAGISNIAFRLLCKKYDCGLCYSEMINANALVRNNKATQKLTQTCKQEKPVAMQLFGTKIPIIKKAVKILEENADIIDFNLGCPAKQIIDQGAGAALLKRPAKIKEIIETLTTNTELPVTAKIRLGINNSKDAIKTAKIIEKAGADALIIHARTASQGYSGKADWNKIKEIKQSLNIPVIGNGDVTDHKTAEEMSKICDGIMIGRAACGNPFIFKQINHYFKTKKLLKDKNKITMFKEYLKLWEKHNLRFADLKQHSFFFTKGIDRASKIRLKISRAENVEEIMKILR